MFEKAKAKIIQSLREVVFSEKFRKFVYGAETSTGITVDQTTVFNLSTVYACINAIAQTIGSLPIDLYRRNGEDKIKDTKHYLYDLLHRKPNPYMLPSAFKEAMMGNTLAWGNGYAEIEFDIMQRPLALWPIPSGRVKPQLVNQELVYDVTLNDRVARLPAYRIFHLPGLSFNGISGVTPIQVSREAFGIAMAEQEYAGRYFKNDANPGGVLEHPARLTDEAYDRLKKEMELMHAGLKNSHRMMLLDGGMKWTKQGLSPADSQLLEQRKFSVNDISRMFRVPPHIIGNLDAATFSNIEQQFIEFLTLCLSPWIGKFEEAINQRVIQHHERVILYSKFNVNSILRGDIKTRYEAYGLGLDRGFLSVNEVRRFEDWNDIAGGDVYYKALNLAPIGNKKAVTEE